ncbi:MAG: CoA ester lyase [Chloroflexi bacterium]|nr:CoA ester lyase [Chloroflexota bacterium]
MLGGPRSLLIMPANRPDMLKKAPTYGADCLIFDLEDAVPIPEKPRARQLARERLGELSGSALVYVRVNAVDTGMLPDDLEAVVVPGLRGIRLAKTESAETVRTVDGWLTELERERSLPAGSIEIGPSLETAKGVWFAYEIASASPRVTSITCGTAQDGDLQADLGYTWSVQGEEVLYVRSRVLVAARAAGVEHLIEGSYPNFKDPEGLAVSCEASRRLGYRGKTAIHPSQIETINRVFTPTQQELDYYRRVIEAFEEALARGSAATSVDGKLVDYAMAARAHRVLDWARGLGLTV